MKFLQYKLNKYTLHFIVHIPHIPQLTYTVDMSFVFLRTCTITMVGNCHNAQLLWHCESSKQLSS